MSYIYSYSAKLCMHANANNNYGNCLDVPILGKPTSSQSLNVSIYVYIFRCDQYRWIHQGTRTLNHPSGDTIYRKSSVIDADSDGRHGDKRFKRHEYWGVGQHYIIHYIGDDTVSQNFANRNSKEKSRPFIRSAPHIKNKVNVTYQAKTDLS